jgi:tetratricopeptide (TPR) repeat protein
VNPKSSVLTALNRDWNAARANADEKSAKIAELLQQGTTALRRGELSSPAGASAIDRFRAVLAIDSDNSDAAAGLRSVAIELLNQANAAIDRKQLDMAEKLLVQAQAISPNNTALPALEKRLADALQASSAVASTTTESDLANQAELLVRFDEAIAAGALDEPVGRSAFDLLKQLERGGRDSPDVAERVQRLSAAFREQFDSAVADSQFERAAAVLVSLRALRVGNISSELRSQLGESVASDIRIRIESGEYDVAQRRLDLLRTINAQHSELESLRLALLQARGS